MEGIHPSQAAPPTASPSFTLENHQLSELQRTVKEILRELKHIQASQPNGLWRRLTYVHFEVVAQGLKALTVSCVLSGIVRNIEVMATW